jgi:hypothetical protein
MSNLQQQEDGTWVEAIAIGPRGPIARLEFWLRARGRFPRIVKALAWLDELPLR